MNLMWNWQVVFFVHSLKLCVSIKNYFTFCFLFLVFSLFSVVTFKNSGCRSQSAMTSGQRLSFWQVETKDSVIIITKSFAFFITQEWAKWPNHYLILTISFNLTVLFEMELATPLVNAPTRAALLVETVHQGNYYKYFFNLLFFQFGVVNACSGKYDTVKLGLTTISLVV